MGFAGKMAAMGLAGAVGLALAAGAAPDAAAQDAAAAFKGKQLRMVISSGAGGGYDTYARVLSRHLVKHVPGRPGVVDQNMPGASGMKATNWTFMAGQKDGLTILATYNALLLEPLFGNTAVEYDPRKFEWVGSISKQQNVCMTWHTSPIRTVEDAKTREVLVSATGATGNSATLPRIVNAMLGTQFRVIGGYSTTESRLAVERGEVEGICGLSWSTLKASNPAWIADKRLNVFLQTGAKPHPDLPDVPLLISKVTSAEDRRILELLGVPEDMGRPFAMPPGSPAHMVVALRRAFDATMKDKDFLAEAAKAQLEVDPLTGEEMVKLIADAYATPAPLVARAADLLGRQTRKQ